MIVTASLPLASLTNCRSSLESLSLVRAGAGLRLDAPAPMLRPPSRGMVQSNQCRAVCNQGGFRFQQYVNTLNVNKMRLILQCLAATQP